MIKFSNSFEELVTWKISRDEKWKPTKVFTELITVSIEDSRYYPIRQTLAKVWQSVYVNRIALAWCEWVFTTGYLFGTIRIRLAIWIMERRSI